MQHNKYSFFIGEKIYDIFVTFPKTIRHIVKVHYTLIKFTDMKKTALISVMICSIIINLTACINVNSSENIFSGKRIKGNGVHKELDRGKMEFTAIDTRGSVDVIISNSTDGAIKVTGDENLVEYVETYVKDGVLNVHLNNKEIKSFSTRIGLKVTVPNNGKINGIKASGSSDVKVEGTVIADNMNISCKGSSDFSGNIKAEKCQIDCTGSSDFKGNVEAKSCEIDCTGSSDFKGSIETTNLSIRCTGSSDCNISGKADVCEISMTGSSDFNGYDFTVNKLTCSASGSSNIKITCNEELDARAAGSSDIYYRGAPQIKSLHSSGSSDIKNR